MGRFTAWTAPLHLILAALSRNEFASCNSIDLPAARCGMVLQGLSSEAEEAP